MKRATLTQPHYLYTKKQDPYFAMSAPVAPGCRQVGASAAFIISGYASHTRVCVWGGEGGFI